MENPLQPSRRLQNYQKALFSFLPSSRQKYIPDPRCHSKSLHFFASRTAESSGASSMASSSLALFSSSSSPSLALCRLRAFSDHLALPCPSLGTSRSQPLDCKFPQLSIGFWGERSIAHASSNGTNAVNITSLDSFVRWISRYSAVSDDSADYVPMPVVLIDQNSDSDATIVQLSFGDRLGALIDTMRALKDLGLDVLKGIVTTEGAVKQTKFYITRLDTGRKVDDPELLERIRLTIINNLLKYHPESSAQLALGEAFGIQAPEKKLDVDIATRIQVKEDGPKRSLLYVETADRPGLLVDIIKNLADINITVESAEIDTEGLVAKDKFYVSYGGAALNSSLSQVLVNCLRYYLRRPETDIDSY